jgi:hypothetical protein
MKGNTATVWQVGWHALLNVETYMSVTCSQIIHLPLE